MLSFLGVIKLSLLWLLGALLSFLSPTSDVARPPAPLALVHIASSPTPTTTTVHSLGAVRSTNTENPRAKSASTTSIPTPAPTPSSVPIPTTPPVEVANIPATSSLISWNSVNEEARAATVNVLCTSVRGGLLNPVSGSGVIIDSRGVVLVNAHLAQFFLIKDYLIADFVSCIIRQGSPAAPRYRARLLYISPSWVHAHYADILTQNPEGTGEDDFALLLLTESAGPSVTFPSTFPHLEVSYVETPSIVGQSVILTAYPAGFLGGTLIQTSLYLSSAPSMVEDVFTFSSNTVDLLSLGGSVEAQHGSSGGAVVRSDGRLVGLIVTSSDAPLTGDRDLHAITISHVDRVLQQEVGLGLSEFLSHDLSETAENFAHDVAPGLSALLSKTLDSASH